MPPRLAGKLRGRGRTLAAISEDRYRLLFDSTPHPMWVVEEGSLRFLAVNQAAVARYGYARADFARMTLAEIRQGEAPERLLEIESADGLAEPPGVWRHRRADGTVMAVEASSQRIDFGGRAARLVMATDVTERLRAEDELRRAALYDALTGLPNRVLFTERLGQAHSRVKDRPGEAFAVLFLDLDRFKVVNDSLGHRAGDELLVQISRRLERIRRSSDTVARLGGDEFSVLVEGVRDAADAAGVAERVQLELAQPFQVGGQEVFMSASIGIALARGGEPLTSDLLRDADTAMYRAKGQGKGTHALFDVGMHDRAVATLQLESDLRRALERDELKVQYQPVVSLSTGRIVGFEALARWLHPRKGLLQPGAFIPVAEETGIIGTLDLFVLRTAACRVSALQRANPRAPPLTLSVNLSGRDVLRPELARSVEGILEETGLDPGSLRLEITETVLVDNAREAARSLTRLRQLGLRVGIDDFGTGYSSLSYLHRLPIDLLKIDASFIRTMPSDEKNRRIVETIVLLGRNLGVEVVAEGVETPNQAAMLQWLGCAFAQGYLYARPVDGEGTGALLSGEADLSRLARPAPRP